MPIYKKKVNEQIFIILYYWKLTKDIMMNRIEAIRIENIIDLLLMKE